jgi:hypothetical protein
MHIKALYTLSYTTLLRRTTRPETKSETSTLWDKTEAKLFDLNILTRIIWRKIRILDSAQGDCMLNSQETGIRAFLKWN